MAETVPANWYPDPTKRHDLRYWDGSLWTDHVVTQHIQAVDPLSPRLDVVKSGQVSDHHPDVTNKKVPRQVRKVNAETDRWRGGGTMLTENVLAINQKAKRFEQLVEYEVFDQKGRALGEIRETGYNHLLSAFTIHSAATRKRELEVVDHAGEVLYRINRPAKVFKPKVELLFADGTHAGSFAKNGLISRKLALEVAETTIGHIEFHDPHNFRASVFDASAQVVASIHRTWAGRRAEKKTRADNYVLEIKHPTLENPLLGLVLTAPVAIDLLFQQGEPDKEDAKRERRNRRWYGA
ncbi:phospholipid scramblase-related protein [Leucobacter sp. HY1910]